MLMRLLHTLIAGALLAPAVAQAAEITYSDPENDDNGPGSYIYPTDRAYARGDFDLTGLSIDYDDEDVEFRVSVKARIQDPWNSEDWNGNGFSVQFVQIYIDMDHTAGSGHLVGLPGVYTNVGADETQAWDRVVLVSPQPASRVRTEVQEKASTLADAVIIPDRTSSRGRDLIARVPRSAFGDSDPATWGVQVLMQSNEGYPEADEVLTRRVNEYEGPHRFGGGNDGECDPHVMDILAGGATGAADEVAAQHAALGSFVCGDGETLATVPLIYR